MVRKFAVLGVLVLGACSESAESPVAVDRSFAVLQHEVNLPIVAQLQSPCNLELIDVTGTAHLRISQDPKGRQTQHVNYQQLAGVGQTTGATYQIIGVQNGKVTVEGSVQTISAVQHVKVVGSGQAPDYSAFLMVTLTYDTDTWTSTSEVKQEREQCR